MSRHFCCCIPVRIAVFITSLLAFLFAACVSGISYFVLIKSNDKNDTTISQISSRQKTGFAIIAGVYTLVALVSLFGFIGSVIRKRSFVAVYSTMTYIFFLIQCSASGFLIYSLFSNHGVIKCQATEANGSVEDCSDLSGSVKGVIVGFLVLQLIIQAYIAVVIKRYVQQLDEEQSYHRTSGYVDSAFKMGPTGTNTAYYPHQPLDQGHGLLAPQGHYPYSDPHHSFGA